jgi:hypothetical protein
MVSVHDVKVIEATVPSTAGTPVFELTSPSTNVWLQVSVPMLVDRTVGPCVVLVIVVEPERKGPPGSVRNNV